MNYLITGGAGFIASHIVDRLLQDNHQVIVVDNFSSGKNENLIQHQNNPNLMIYQRDILENLNDIFEKEKPEIVIHMAAQVMLRKSIEEPIFDAKTNILGTINILETCKKFNIRKLIYTSTGGARVGEPEYLPVDEKHNLAPCSPYGISKHTAEHYVEMYGKLYDLDYLIFCFGNVYGPRDDPSCKRVTSIFSHQMLNNQVPKIFGDGNQTRDFIYVKDLANFIVDSIEKNPEHKLFHLANGEQISVNQVFNILKELISFEKDAEHVEAIKGEVKDIVLDTTLAKQELGWTVKTDFRQGLKETVEHMQNYLFNSSSNFFKSIP